MRLAPVAMAVAAATLPMLMSACGVPDERADRPVGALPYGLDQAATTTTSTTTTIPVEPPETSTTAAPPLFALSPWFIRGDRIEPARRALKEPPTLDDALTALLAGPLTSVDGPGLRSAIADAQLVHSVVSASGQATVELDGRFSSLPGGEQILALGQIVFTVTETPGVGLVTFRVAGVERPLAVPLPDGQLSQEPVSRDSYATLVAGDVPGVTDTTAVPTTTPVTAASVPAEAPPTSAAAPPESSP